MNVRRGKHSLVYLVGKYAVKVFDDRFLLNFRKEVRALRILQPFGFVPALYSVGRRFVVMERVDGVEIRNAELTSRLIDGCMRCCLILDVLGIQKEEMHRPDRHILVKRGGSIKFIDFERSVFTEKPSNLTQFAVYVCRRLDLDLKSYLDILKEYRKSGIDGKLRKYDELRKLLLDQVG